MITTKEEINLDVLLKETEELITKLSLTSPLLEEQRKNIYQLLNLAFEFGVKTERAK